MSKKFSSLLVGAFAAALLVAPTQAQTLARKALPSKQPQTALKVNDRVAKLQRKGAKQLDVTQQGAKPQRIDEQALPERVDLGQGTPIQAKRTLNGVPMKGVRVADFANRVNHASRQIPVNVPHYAAAPTQDGNGVITAPDAGEHKFYKRAGTAYYPNSGQLYYTDQSGNVEIVEAADGVVYIKDIVSMSGSGTWVKGTKSGNTITVATGQPVSYNSNYATTLSIYWAAYDAAAQNWDKVSTDITFTVEGDVISLVGSDESNVIAVFWDDDDSFSGYGDYETVWTLDADYQPASTELVEAPAGLVTETWNTEGTDYANGPFIGTATVGFDGNDVYVKGIFTAFPNSWIKGTVDGTTVTFPGLQFLGTYSGSYNIWAVGYNGALGDILFNYDAEAKTLTLDESNYLVANAAEDRLYYLQAIVALTISNAPIEEPTIATGDPVNVLPYTNGFETAEEQAQFGVYDANHDGNTWNYYDLGGNTAVRYIYSTSANANEWLVSPAIYMEAGRTYRFAADVWAMSAGYPERIEVTLGAEPKASALTQQVIEPTVVNWTSSAIQTLENQFLTVAESGYYHFGIHAISDADKYYLYVDNVVVELGTDPAVPAAVTDLTVTNYEGEEAGAVITFTAPATAVSGAALTENITIDLYRDAALIKTFEDVVPGAVITYTDLDVAVGTHKYQAIPSNAAGTGLKGEVAQTLVTAVQDVPVTFDFTVSGVFDVFTVIDANQDGRTWGYNVNGYAYSAYSTSNDADDYLVTLPIKVKGGKNYNVVVNARAYSSNYPERFEVVAGTAPTVEALTNVVIPVTDLVSNESDDYEGSFTAPADGEYYVAVHALSDADNYYVVVNSITVEDGVEPTAPRAPRLAVQPDPYGAEKTVVTVTAAAKTVEGNKYSYKSTLNIYRDNLLIKQIDNVGASDIKIFVDNEVEAGTHVYQAIPYDNEGNRGQKSEKVAVFVGEDVPATVADIELVDNGNTLSISWPAVTTGFNGGYVDPATVTYNVWSMQLMYSQWFGYYLDYDTQLGTLTGETSLEVAYNTDEGEQESKYFGVFTENEQGTSDYYLAESIVVGAPYVLPFNESFVGNTLHYFWSYSDDAYLSISNEASDDDNVALKLVTLGESETSFTSGKLSLAGAANPTLVFDVKSDAINKMLVKGSVNGGKLNVLKSTDVTGNYSTVKVPLSSLAGGRYAQVSLVADLPVATEYEYIGGQYVFYWGDSVLIDNIRILDLYEYNLAASISAPKTVQAGNAAKVTVTVENLGELAAKDFTVNVYAGESRLFSQKVEEELASFKKISFETELPTTIFDDPDDITVIAEVDYDIDLDDDDNLAATVVTVKQSSAAAPENVKAQATANGVSLSWEAPATSTQDVTESFEDYEAWSLGGIDADNHYGAFGDWTLYDGNGIGVYGFEGTELPNAYQPQAWQVVRPEDVEGMSANYAPHSGDQYLLSFCPADEVDGQEVYPAADHWLISPALPGVAQTLSFFYRTITDQYGAETFEVLYSTTDNQVGSFSKLADYTTTETEWTELTVNLPAGTTYFAIRHTSQDIFGLLIDDVQYVQGGGEISEYNIWDVATSEVLETVSARYTSFVVNGGSSDNLYAVSAVYSTGAQSRPVIAVYSGNGNQELTAIEQITGSNEPVDVYSLDGRLVRSQATSLKGLKGVYVINGQKAVVK